MPDLVIPGMGHPSHDRIAGQDIVRKIGNEKFIIPAKFANLTDDDRPLLTRVEIAQMKALAMSIIPRDIPTHDQQWLRSRIDEHYFEEDMDCALFYHNFLISVERDCDLGHQDAFLMQCCLFGRIPNEVLEHALKRDQLWLFERHYTVACNAGHTLIKARALPPRIEKILALAHTITLQLLRYATMGAMGGVGFLLAVFVFSLSSRFVRQTFSPTEE